MKSRKAEKELQSSLQREPTQAEIADRVGITEQRLHELRKVLPVASTRAFTVMSTSYGVALVSCNCMTL